MDNDPLNLVERFRPFAKGKGQSLRELISLFFRSMREDLEELDKDVGADDAKEVERIAHKAAGPCDMFGFPALAGLLRELEESASRGDLAGARALMEKAHEEFDRLRPE